MNIPLLEKILKSNYEHWVIKQEYGNGSTPAIIFCSFPLEVPRGLKRENIRLIDLERLYRIDIENVFLNKNIYPFQIGVNLSSVTEAHPVTCNPKEFLKRALQLESNDIRKYVTHTTRLAGLKPPSTMPWEYRRRWQGMVIN